MHSWVCVLFLVCGVWSPSPRSRGSQADAGGEKSRGTFEGVTFLRLSPPLCRCQGRSCGFICPCLCQASL